MNCRDGSKSIHPNEEMILKDTKNTIEDTVEKIKENVRENKLSCILMIGFVLLFCVLSGPEIAAGGGITARAV